VGLSDRADPVDVAFRFARCRSCLSRAGNFRNRDTDRVDRLADLLFVAQAGAQLVNPALQARAKHYCYACKIEETTDGGRRGAGGKTRPAFEVVASRRFSANVQVDEPKRASPRGQNQAQVAADQKTEA
jgi:hypothetical protein